MELQLKKEAIGLTNTVVRPIKHAFFLLTLLFDGQHQFDFAKVGLADKTFKGLAHLIMKVHTPFPDKVNMVGIILLPVHWLASFESLLSKMILQK